jgi:hypothetical protein
MALMPAYIAVSNLRSMISMDFTAPDDLFNEVPGYVLQPDEDAPIRLNQLTDPEPEAGISVNLGHPQGRALKSTLNFLGRIHAFL